VKTVVALVLTVALAIAAGQWTVGHLKPAPVKEVPGNGVYHVVKVYDGDTIKLDNGEKIRLIGIDTPESHDNPKLTRDMKKLNISREKILAMGRKAAEFSQALLMGKDVRLEFDVEPRDRYQRQLAYVYLTDGTFVNDTIIREGYAYPLTIPPNVRYAERFKQAFNEAREHNRGLWGN
jgi:micrococcal nuclease